MIPEKSLMFVATESVVSLNKSISAKLRSINNELSSIAKDTETEFLDLGAKLQNFAMSCNSNSSRASVLVQSIDSGSGFSASSLMELFTRVYKEIEHTGSFAIDTKNNMLTLLDHIQNIPALTVFLKKLSHSINIIGTLIRIETARIAQAEFNVMTEVVDSLASQIAQGTQEINTSIVQARDAVQTIFDNIDPFIYAFNANLCSAKDRIDTIVNDLGNMDRQAKWLCERIGIRAADITPEIGHVVSSLQIHDITRQQIEHVCDAFGDILSKLENHSYDSEKDKIVILKWTVDALKIQVAQINMVMNETQKAFDGIAKPLLRVSELVEAQAEDANLLLEEEKSGKNKLKVVGTVLDALINILDVVNKMTVDMMGSVDLVNSKLEGLTSQVTNIETISESINMLALNAIIKVSRTGDKGRGLNVLANEISKLSASAKGKIEEGSAVINSILSMTSEFRDTLKVHLNQRVESSEEVTKQTRVAIKDLLANNEKLIKSMNDISKDTRMLKTEIEKVVSKIAFDKIIKGRLQNAIGILEGLMANVEALIPEHDYDDIEYAPDMSDMLKRYTMQSERIIHETALMEKELQQGDTYDNGGTAKKDDDSLDDNIELF